MGEEGTTAVCLGEAGRAGGAASCRWITGPGSRGAAGETSAVVTDGWTMATADEVEVGREAGTNVVSAGTWALAAEVGLGGGAGSAVKEDCVEAALVDSPTSTLLPGKNRPAGASSNVPPQASTSASLSGFTLSCGSRARRQHSSRAMAGSASGNNCL